MANPIEIALGFLVRNFIFIVPICVIAYLVYRYLTVTRKAKLKPLDRSEVERLRFIERMKYNKPSIYKWFKRGEIYLGKIEYARNFTTGNPTKDLEVTQLVVRPLLLNIGRIRLSNIFTKLQCFQIATKHIQKDLGDETLFVDDWIHFDKYFGVYYDGSQERDHTNIIKEDNILRTDLNELASIYFVKAQEQSTYNPDYAHRLALEQKKIEVELAKRKGKAETI